jgi:hypothetical protein
MAACGACGSTVLFAGRKSGELTFCNDRCLQRGRLLIASRRLPADVVAARVSEVHRGPCPRCEGSGPIDVRFSYRVYSVILMTSWVTRTHVCCRSCGRKAQAGDLLFSLILGWWGLPWGLVVTPVQIVRNIVSMTKSDEEGKPSVQLENAVRIALASNSAAA